MRLRTNGFFQILNVLIIISFGELVNLRSYAAYGAGDP